MRSLFTERRLQWIAAFLLYFAAGWLGLSVPFTSGNVSPVWPSAGLGLAALLLWRLDLWTAIAAAAFLVNLLTPIPAPAAVALGFGNAAAALFGAYALRRAGVKTSLASLRDVLALGLIGAVAAPMISASVGTAALFAAGVRPWSHFGAAWRVWWLGDGMGVLLAAPVLLTVAEMDGLRRRRLAEFAALIGGLGLVAFFVFGRGSRVIEPSGLPALTLFPFIVWAAIRFGLPGAAMVSASIAAAAVFGTSMGYGPFVHRTTLLDAALMQLFLAVVSATGLIIAAVMNERKETQSAMRALSGRVLKLQDEERRRLVRDLHDGTGQNLTALILNLATLRGRDSALDGQAKQALRRSLELAEEVVRDIRTLCSLLHPPLLEEVGLVSALKWYAENLEKRGDLKIDLGVPEDWRRLPQEVETALFRIAQEALTNVVRHSGTRSASVLLEEGGGRVRLQVRDRGRGLAEDSYGVGIVGMRERVRELGGSLVIESADPGTSVEVTLPIGRRSSPA